MIPLTFTRAPGAGNQVLGVTVSDQAFRDKPNSHPASVRLAVPVREVALVGRTLPTPTANRS